MIHHRKNLQRKWQIFLTLVLILYMADWNYSNAVAIGATYYVDRTNPSCSDMGSGTTTALPFCTIGKGASIAVAGDTVRVLAGTYAETVNGPNSGNAGNPITFTAVSGVTVTGMVQPAVATPFVSHPKVILSSLVLQSPVPQTMACM